MTTIEEVRKIHSQTVYDELMANYDATKWADITPITDGEECDITKMKIAVFTFDLDAWATACATVAGCTFDKTLYEPNALGFLWKTGGVTTCGTSGDAPYILTKPDGRTMPFAGLYWNHGISYYAAVYETVTYDDSTFMFDTDGTNYCYYHLFLEGCFADLRANDYYFSFSLL